MLDINGPELVLRCPLDYLQRPCIYWDATDIGRVKGFVVPLPLFRP